MEIEFGEPKYREWCENEAAAQKALGEKLARCYARRIATIYACEGKDDFFKIPQFRFHPLKGDRDGQFSIDMDYRFRLIVSFPNNSTKKVRIEEVSNHYGD